MDSGCGCTDTVQLRLGLCTQPHPLHRNRGTSPTHTAHCQNGRHPPFHAARHKVDDRAGTPPFGRVSARPGPEGDEGTWEKGRAPPCLYVTLPPSRAEARPQIRHHGLDPVRRSRGATGEVEGAGVCDSNRHFPYHVASGEGCGPRPTIQNIAKLRPICSRGCIEQN